MAALYTPTVLDHCANPRNFGILDPFDVSHEDENPLCGDHIRIDLRIAGDTLSAIRFSGSGCAISIAAASILSDMVDGRDLTAIASMDADDLLAELGVTLTTSRRACALLGLNVIQTAIIAHSNRLTTVR